MIKRIKEFLKNNYMIKNKWLFWISIILAVGGFIYTILWYQDILPNNYWEYYIWPLSIIFFIGSIDSQKQSFRRQRYYLYRTHNVDLFWNTFI